MKILFYSPVGLGQGLKEKIPVTILANTLCKSNVNLWLYFGNLRKLLSANVDVTQPLLG